ncbi:hypothetical protein [Vibrio amylolyticus]|nr:hypothetical protein [Vibrio amylolyticus]
MESRLGWCSVLMVQITIWKREKLNTREMRVKQSQSMNIDV